jgi:serine/threonine protein phosphatase PrpC
MVYTCNVGDSRAILSSDSGQKISSLSRDHKPDDEIEYARILQGGGKVYQYILYINIFLEAPYNKMLVTNNKLY